MSLYAKVHARRLEDPRVHDAARRLSQAMRIPEDLSLMAILGFIASIDLWLVTRGEQGEDGLLPGDGYAALRQSTMVGPELARASIRALQEAQLLKTQGATTVRLGFREDYHDLIGGRVYARNRRASRGMRRRSTRRRPVVDAQATSPPTEADLRCETLEPLTSTASDSKGPVGPAVDLRSREAPAEASAQAPPAPATEAPGGTPTPPCLACIDGLVRQKGQRPRCCRLCQRGRDRGRNQARAISEDRAQEGRAAKARAEGAAGRRGGAPATAGAVIPSLLARLGVVASAGPPGGSGPGHGAA